MRSALPLILLSLMCVATTIAPAVADTPTTPPASAIAPRTMYERVIAGVPGAWLELHMQLLFEAYSAGEGEYIRQRGRYTQSASEAIAAGDFPFRPVNNDGSVWPVVDVPIEQIVPPATIGLRNRPTDQMLLMMGADGDPLAPCMRSRDLTYYPLGWPIEYPWRMRLASKLKIAVMRQFEAAVALSGRLPVSPAELQQIVQMAPSGCSWQASMPSDGIAVLVEIDNARQLLRLTASPQPESVQAAVSQFDAAKHSLSSSPYLALQPAQWERWGVLVWDAPIPTSLSTWSTPEPPPYEKFEFAHHFMGASGTFQVSREFAWIGACYLATAGRMPTVEELIAADWGLHVPLDKDGSALHMQHFQLSEFTYDRPKLAVPVDRSTFPTGLLIDVDATAVMTLKQEASAPGKLSSGNFASKQEVTALTYEWGAMPSTTVTVTPLNGHAAAAWELWQRNPTQIGSSDEQALWTHMTFTDRGFEYRYLMNFQESLTEPLGAWLRHHPELSDSLSWAAILDEVDLKPRRYTILNSGEQPPPGWATMSLEYAALPGIMRCTSTHPSGLRFIDYKAVANVEQTGPHELWTIGARSSPEVTALDYQHVVTIALPIPEPPLIDKDVTP